MKEQLFRLSLQFFGDAPEDSNEDFEDDFFDDDEEEEESGEDLGGGDDTEEEEKENDPEEEEETDEDGTKGTDPEDEKSAVIKELKANGYVGDDLAALTSDMKKKREAREAADKSRERREANAEGKAHVKSSRPGKSATGGSGGAFTERQVTGLAERTGCSKDRARELLAKHQRLINGG